MVILCEALYSTLVYYTVPYYTALHYVTSLYALLRQVTHTHVTGLLGDIMSKHYNNLVTVFELRLAYVMCITYIRMLWIWMDGSLRDL